jgi:hypothetical protein
MSKEPKNQPEIKRPETLNDMEEVESPNFFRFENIGDSVEGYLVGTTRSEQFGFGMYQLNKDDGTSVRIHGSADLDDKMAVVVKDQWVRIEYYDQKKMAKGTMKLFRVMRRKSKTQVF